MQTATFIWSFHCLFSFLPVLFICLAHVWRGEQHCEPFHALKGNYLRPFSIAEKRTVGSYRLIRYTLLGSEHFAREGEGLLEQVEYDRNKPLYNAYTLLIHQLQNIHKLNNESTVLDISDPIRLGTVINPPHICSLVLCWHRCTWHPPKITLKSQLCFCLYTCVDAMSTLSVSWRVGGCVFKIARKGNARNPSEFFEVASARSGRLMFLTDFKVLRRAGILLWIIQPVDRRESFALHIASRTRWVHAFVSIVQTYEQARLGYYTSSPPPPKRWYFSTRRLNRPYLWRCCTSLSYCQLQSNWSFMLYACR